MQRIAAVCAGVFSLLLLGCATPVPQHTLGPPPQPTWETRAPATITPLVPPSAPPPQAHPPGSTIATTIRAVPGGIQHSRWQAIVVHHSAVAEVSPQSMDSAHRQRGWDELGYHFVIGNGIGYPDGRLYIGGRWLRQKHGAHCKVGPGRYFGVQRPDNYFNEHGIGICLIGNLDRTHPTARQMQTLRELLAALCREGAVPASAIYGHGEVTGRTACPGRHLSIPQVRQAVAAVLDSSGAVPLADRHSASSADGAAHVPAVVVPVSTEYAIVPRAARLRRVRGAVLPPAPSAGSWVAA
ncbi:MAG: N-acetylmuramoyl-L-alanine amidase [Phycisphaerales bacterium]|nr:N-acetylmuramoyl-L-alanine amidase [Phycisphaerales bacterium]